MVHKVVRQLKDKEVGQMIVEPYMTKEVVEGKMTKSVVVTSPHGATFTLLDKDVKDFLKLRGYSSKAAAKKDGWKL